VNTYVAHLSSLFTTSRLSFVLRYAADPYISSLSLHDALPIWLPLRQPRPDDSESADPRHECRRAVRFHRPEREYGVRRLQLPVRSEEHTSELQSRENLVCRLLLEKKKYEPLLFGPALCGSIFF